MSKWIIVTTPPDTFEEPDYFGPFDTYEEAVEFGTGKLMDVGAFHVSELRPKEHL